MNKLKRINLRWAKQLVWIVLLTGLCLYLNGSPPFMAVGSSSMEPTFSRGDLIFSSKVNPDMLKVGDVIVYNVPKAFQAKYGYPTSVCHRIVRIQTGGKTIAFRTKGDAAGEDPFMVTPESVVGKQTTAIHFLGYAVMFPQTIPGLIFLGGLLMLLLIYWNSSTLSKSAHSLRSALVGVSNKEFVSSQNKLETKIESMSSQVSLSMNSFASAMSEYAQHIASHTSAIKSLARVAEHLESVITNPERSTPKTVYEAPQPASQESPVPEPVKPIEVTPELKAAVKRFIADYSREHNLGTLEVTPELRTAVWEFIQKYVYEPAPMLISNPTVPAEEINNNPVEHDPADSETPTLAG